MRKNALVRLLLCCGSLYFGVFALADVSDEIRNINQALSMAEQPHDLPDTVIAAPVLPVFYQSRDYQPAWRDPDQVRDILQLLAESRLEGLEPEDYHYSVVKNLFDSWDPKEQRSDRRRARFDVLLTDGLLLYYRHLVEGKVDPGKMEASWNYSRRDFDPRTVNEGLTRAIGQNTVREEIQLVTPDMPFYHQMKASLARYRKIAAEYPFEALDDSKTLRPGDDDPTISGLRRRLRELGYFDDPSTSTAFDDPLAEAVKLYQASHGLDADGILGRQSWAQLNVPYDKRVEQLRINLDRLRWIREDRSDDFIVVNIAGFELYHMLDGQLNWTSDVMVGKVKTQTPMFHSRMSYLVLNPTWTVPRSIIRRSLWGKFSADPGYVNSHNFHLYDSDGKLVDPLGLDWSQYSAGRFPFRVVQQPGPSNALGQVKFMFPNQHAIYLHDTPSRQLFSQTARAFSSGCIRVKDPLELARILLEPNGDWDKAAIEAKIEEGGLQNVHLKKPVDVLLMYWTTSPMMGQAERVNFHLDIYDRDPAVMEALKQPPVWIIR